jgi:hypothetical protein
MGLGSYFLFLQEQIKDIIINETTKRQTMQARKKTALHIEMSVYVPTNWT